MPLALQLRDDRTRDRVPQSAMDTAALAHPELTPVRRNLILLMVVLATTLYGTTLLVVSTILFAMLFRFLPDVELLWKDVVMGAFVTAVLFTVGKHFIGLYLGQSAIASSYGAAGSVIVLLLWVYYSAQILLLGAEFTRLYAGRRVPAAPFAVKTAAPRRPMGRQIRGSWTSSATSCS